VLKIGWPSESGKDKMKTLIRMTKRWLWFLKRGDWLIGVSFAVLCTDNTFGTLITGCLKRVVAK